MRFQFSVLQLLEWIAIVGLTIAFDQWAIGKANQQDAATLELTIAWGSLMGVYFATRSVRPLGAPLCGLTALIIAVAAVLLNGCLIAWLSPGVFLRPSPFNPFPLASVEQSELGRLVLLTALVSGLVGAVGALVYAGYVNLLQFGRRQA